MPTHSETAGENLNPCDENQSFPKASTKAQRYVTEEHSDSRPKNVLLPESPRVFVVIMGGGRGTRLYPLTQMRCKPAVPLAGKFRLIDIPISNCINSGYNKIYVLTQFNTASLHRHIFETFSFDAFSRGFVEILSAEQRSADSQWYQGTADAVRQNMHHFLYDHTLSPDDVFLILSGDQLYRMDFREIVAHHLKHKADVTIAAKAVRPEEACHFGIMRVKEDLSIEAFFEKPKDPAIIDSLLLPGPSGASCCLASMGIYVFSRRVLEDVLKHPGSDFGKEIIPSLVGSKRLVAFPFEGYWEDIGTVSSFFQANLMLTDAIPPFNFFDNDRPVFSRSRHLPASKINSCNAEQAIIADGCILSNVTLKRCVIGIRSCIGEGTYLENVVMIGADHFNTLDDFERSHDPQKPLRGVGKNCHIVNTIIDKNACIGNNVHLSPAGKQHGFQSGDVHVRDGVLIVAKGAVIPDNIKI
jgi:glucose-1-phosphate adenylyltransferase